MKALLVEYGKGHQTYFLHVKKNNDVQTCYCYIFSTKHSSAPWHKGFKGKFTERRHLESFLRCLKILKALLVECGKDYYPLATQEVIKTEAYNCFAER